MNSFHITIRTPPEVLGAISSYLDEDDLFSTSQVCKHWRLALIAYASLWTQISCSRGTRAIASIGRCGSLPIHLRLESPFSSAVLEEVLLRGKKVASLNVNHRTHQISQLQQLFVLSRPSVERLLSVTDDLREGMPEDKTVREIWQDFPVLRELFVILHSVPIDRLTAPNLVHLALEYTGRRQNVTVQSILGMLHGCPLLETLLFNRGDFIAFGLSQRYNSVSLPHLRSIEVGAFEVYSGLISHLDFPRDVEVGFQRMFPDSLYNQIPNTILAAIQYVLRRINIRRITLAAYLPGEEFLIRFEGPRGSLEITTAYVSDHPKPSDFLLGPRGVLFSLSPHIKTVTELHIVECAFDTDKGLDHVKAAMPNIDTITFFQRNGSYPFGPLTAGDTSSLLFPRLERVMVLGSESRLEEMARNRRDLGVPLKTLVLGRDPGFNYDRLEGYSALKELVGDLRVGRPVEIVEWGAGRRIVDVWSTANAPRPVSSNAVR